MLRCAYSIFIDDTLRRRAMMLTMRAFYQSPDAAIDYAFAAVKISHYHDDADALSLSARRPRDVRRQPRRHADALATLLSTMKFTARAGRCDDAAKRLGVISRSSQAVFTLLFLPFLISRRHAGALRRDKAVSFQEGAVAR